MSTGSRFVKNSTMTREDGFASVRFKSWYYARKSLMITCTKSCGYTRPYLRTRLTKLGPYTIEAEPQHQVRTLLRVYKPRHCQKIYEETVCRIIDKRRRHTCSHPPAMRKTPACQCPEEHRGQKGFCNSDKHSPRPLSVHQSSCC